MTLRYLIAAAVIIAAMIMVFYSAAYARTVRTESSVMLDAFEDTYKFMMDKEDETVEDIEKDIDVSEKLIESARGVSGDEFSIGAVREIQDGGDKERLIEEGVDYQSALDDLASAYGCDFLSLEADGSGDYIITAATNGYTAYDRLSEIGLVPLADSTESWSRGIERVSGKNSIVICTKVFDTKLEPDDAAMMIVPLQAFIDRSSALTAAFSTA